MLSLVSDWKASGLSQKAFSKLHGISVATLGYWLARSKEWESGRGGFIEMTVASTLKNDQVEVIYPNGVRIKSDSDPGLLSQLIRLY